jgi:hypothetical protein
MARGGGGIGGGSRGGGIGGGMRGGSGFSGGGMRGASAAARGRSASPGGFSSSSSVGRGGYPSPGKSWSSGGGGKGGGGKGGKGNWHRRWGGWGNWGGWGGGWWGPPAAYWQNYYFPSANVIPYCTVPDTDAFYQCCRNAQYSDEVCSQPQMACAISNQALNVGLGGPAVDLSRCCATQSYPPGCLGAVGSAAVSYPLTYY